VARSGAKNNDFEKQKGNEKNEKDAKKEINNDVLKIKEELERKTKMNKEEEEKKLKDEERKKKITQEENVEVSVIRAELEKEKKRADEYFEHLKRNMADFDNYKKRMEKEKDSTYKVVASNVASSILPVLDNFENAISQKTEDLKFKEGIEMIFSQTKDILIKLGVSEIEAVGKTFDPNFHEAVMHIEDENYDKEQVIEILRKGYMLGDRVIRHAMVKVAN